MVVDGVFVALGSNLGDRAAHLAAAVQKLSNSRGVRVLRCSSLHETIPVGGPPGQGKYLNAVAELSTDLPPHDLLGLLLRIEHEQGRVRREPNSPRTLDLDLLLYGNVHLLDPSLTLPHPRMWNREFVLIPLLELIGEDHLVALRRAFNAEPAQERAAIVK